MSKRFSRVFNNDLVIARAKPKAIRHPIHGLLRYARNDIMPGLFWQLLNALFSKGEEGQAPSAGSGQALPLVLVALAVGTLVVVPFLGHSSTALLTSRSYRQAIIEQYSADSGIEHALWRLKYEPDFANSLTLANPTTNYTLNNINGMSVNVTMTYTYIESPPVPQPPPEGTQSNRVIISKTVSSCSAAVSENVTFTYTIAVTNNDTSRIHFDEIGDLLPPGFSYVDGSSNLTNLGNADPEPVITNEGARKKLVWGTQPQSPKPSVDRGQTGTMGFGAWVILGADVYWNEAWATWVPDSVSTVATGSTAPVGGGYCPYAYDILAQADGTTILSRAVFGATGLSILSWQVE
ncbi:MAG: hypothetical protein HYX84_05835 [Chloroflexi bacterium]|nr:hypothetical protein [Chloroflexota bacterium]